MNLLLVLTSMAALHADPAASHAMVVHVHDLNLHSVAGSAMAVQRIHEAAKVFCSARASGPHDVDVTVLKCRRDMSARAVARLRSDEVRAMAEEAPDGTMYAGR